MEIDLLFIGKEYRVEINRAHYIRRLGYPKDYEVSEEIEASMKWAVQWYQKNGNPWLQIYELSVCLKDEKLTLNNVETQAPKVYKRFKKYGVEKALLIASTAGSTVDEQTTKLWSSDYPDRAFFLDTYAASVAEAIVSFAVDYIDAWSLQKNMKALSRYSPGYPGWELKEQYLLMDIIENLAKEDIPITISDTALLAPLKSQLSLVGIPTGEENEKPIDLECLECNFVDCACRGKGMFVKL